MTLEETIAKNIQAIRVKNRYTQTALAKEIGVSGKAMSRWEQTGSPTISHLRKLAEFFNLAPHWFLREHKENQTAKK